MDAIDRSEQWQGSKTVTFKVSISYRPYGAVSFNDGLSQGSLFPFDFAQGTSPPWAILESSHRDDGLPNDYWA